MITTDTAGALASLACPAVLRTQGVVSQGLGQGADGVPALAARALAALCCGGALCVRGEELTLGAAAQTLTGGALRPGDQATWASAPRVTQRYTALVTTLLRVSTVALLPALHDAIATDTLGRGVHSPAVMTGADHLGHVASTAGTQLHVARLETEAASLVHQVVAGLAPALAASTVMRSSEAVADLVAEGQSRDPLRHLEVVPAEGDHARVEALVDVRGVLLMDVEPVLVTDTAIGSSGSPCEAN